jgi:hypothetical protein
MTDTTTQLDADVKRYLELDAIKADMQIEQDAIKARLRDLGAGVHHAPCGVNVSVTPNRRFNADKATEVLPPALLEQIQTLSVDTKKAKAVLPPAAYETCMTEVGEPRVSIR